MLHDLSVRYTTVIVPFLLVSRYVVFKPFKKLLNSTTTAKHNQKVKQQEEQKRESAKPLKCEHCGISSIFANRAELMVHTESCDMQLVKCPNLGECLNVFECV